MAYDDKHRFNRTQLISSAAWRPHCQFADLLDLYFGLSCNRYKELRGSGFPLEPIAGEARVLIPALLVRSTSILAPSKVYLSFHPSIRPCICPSLPPCWSLLYCHKEGADQPPFSVKKKKAFDLPSALWHRRKGWIQPNHNERPFISTWASVWVSMSGSSRSSSRRPAHEASLSLLHPPNRRLQSVADPPAPERMHLRWEVIQSLCIVPACSYAEIIANNYCACWLRLGQRFVICLSYAFSHMPH